MGSKKTDPCSVCGTLMWPSPKDAAAIRMCIRCRRAARDRVCVACGSHFMAKTSTEARLYCGRSCSSPANLELGRSALAAAQPRLPIVECGFCAKEFPAKIQEQGNGRRQRAKFCSHDCYVKKTKADLDAARPRFSEWRSILPTCGRCGAVTYRGKSATYCAECVALIRRERDAKWRTEHRKPRELVTVECGLCGCDVETLHPTTKFCRRCRKATRKGDHRHRARKYGVDYEPINPAEIYARDKWICHICTEPIRRVPGNEVDIDGWSLDHIIPMSKGGPHLKWNVAASHWGCNVLKGDQFFVAA